VSRRAFALSAAIAVVVACSEPKSAKQPLLVFAAASLTAPFGAIETAFEAAHPDVDVRCNFAGSPQLVLQIVEGAPADVFASADPANLQKVVAAGKAGADAKVFAKNRLAIVVKDGNPRGIRGLADLARPGHRVALCGPDVPAGRYARQALEQSGLVVSSLSDEPSVKALVAKVLLGELDAGIVYVTDCRTKGVAAVAIPDDQQVVAEYPIVVCRTGANPGAAAAFVAFVGSPEGRAALTAHGFEAP